MYPIKKIYLAGPCDSEHRTMMVQVAKTIRENGYEVYCPFELKIENAWDMSQEAWSKKVFDKDIEAINNCDYIIMISLGRISTAGTNWEQGYAYALNKPIYVFQITNEPTSLMTYCGCTHFVNTNKYEVYERISYILYAIKNSVMWSQYTICTTTLT